MKRTLETKMLDIIYNQAFLEEGKFYDTENIQFLHRMRMCQELAKAMKSVKEREEKRERHTDRD